MRDSFSARDTLRELYDTDVSPKGHPMNRDEYISKTCNILIRSFALTTQQALMLKTSFEAVWDTSKVAAAEADRRDYERALDALHDRIKSIIKPVTAVCECGEPFVTITDQPQAVSSRCKNCGLDAFAAEQSDFFDRNVAARQGSRF